MLDASVGVPLVREEHASSPVEAAIRGWTNDGHRLVVPAHFWLEIASSLRHRHHHRGESIVEAIHQLDTFGLETIDIEREHVLLVIGAMERHGLSAYDATYLVVAEALGGWLVSLDRELLEAAGEIALDPTTRRLSESRARYGTSPQVTWPAYGDIGRFLARLREEARRDEVAFKG